MCIKSDATLPLPSHTEITIYLKLLPVSKNKQRPRKKEKERTISLLYLNSLWKCRSIINNLELAGLKDIFYLILYLFISGAST